ncbi:heat shock protein HSP20 [Candidatus Nitrosopumilus koreensis AR1]|uniref:Heat shock protein HSP20 n=1 Tax=Candidatus Nitrosopumilus koreensis AR1 TaxID=1229908 RepID=K0B8J1_9ARCH|nr:MULTISPECIES: archaeal heat shock protein Hsp20 [Nitrosopumilus]AFS81295.1 heat shock protein HSP20 [Candidatus Nitrosopumilus koreensis AR1]
MGDIFESPNDRTVQTFGPYYYGYVKTVGEDGIPHVTEWGNAKPANSLADTTVRDPYVDVSVNEQERTLKIVSEMPGIEKSDIKLNVSDKQVLLSAQHGERKYEKKIPLPSKVDENSAKAKYTNGVLELTIHLAKEKPQGKLVSVE